MNKRCIVRSPRSAARIVGASALLFAALGARAQSAPDGKAPAAADLAFDLAAIHEDRPGSVADDDQPESNVPLGPGNVYSPTRGVFQARDVALISYIAFAYRMTDAQLASVKAAVPDWVNDERFSIDARTDKREVTKNELRLMMRSLLRDRFGLLVHVEARETPVYALMLVRRTQTGPHLQRRHADDSCPTVIPGKNSEAGKPSPETVAGGFPYTCGGIILLPPSAAHHVTLGARGISMSLFVNSLTSWGQLTRPLVDRTGLTGEVSFVLDYVPDPGPAREAQVADQAMDGPNFRTALKQQLGLKLEPGKGSVDVIVVDHIDHLTPN